MVLMIFCLHISSLSSLVLLSSLICLFSALSVWLFSGCLLGLVFMITFLSGLLVPLIFMVSISGSKSSKSWSLLGVSLVLFFSIFFSCFNLQVFGFESVFSFLLIQGFYVSWVLLLLSFFLVFGTSLLFSPTPLRFL